MCGNVHRKEGVLCNRALEAVIKAKIDLDRRLAYNKPVNVESAVSVALSVALSLEREGNVALISCSSTLHVRSMHANEWLLCQTVL